ncbi:hypothetical protein ACP6PL_20415 [Dapis sp. BLCC M126]|uniref:calcium-binding protein n=1 Tax=Dapis sp. BLCC M126 TaxID=3400189 RepID=UPI003CF57531
MAYKAKDAYYTKVADEDVYYYFQDDTLHMNSTFHDNKNTEFERNRRPDSSETVKYRTYRFVHGTESGDTILGNGSEQTSWGLNVPAKKAYYNGHGGNDIIRSRDAADTMVGGAGNDRIYGNAANDHLEGNEGNDFIDGGTGSDTIRGGAGNDFLLSGRIEPGDSDILTGGTGSNTFLLGSAEPPTVNKPNPFDIDGKDLALSMAGDISDLAFTVFGLNKVAKEIVPVVFDIVKSFTKAGQEKIEAPATGAAYAQITDFNPRKDVVIIPIAAEGPSNVFISKDTNGSSVLSFKYDSVDIGSDIFATLDFAPEEEIFGEGTQVLNHQTVKSIQESLQRNALFIDSNGVSIGHSNLNSLSNPQEPLEKLNIDTSALENLGTNRFMVLGAYSGQVFDNTDRLYQYGTDFGDVLSGYSLSSRGTIKPDPAQNFNDQLYGYNGDDIFYGGAGSDFLSGGQGSDTSSYIHSKAAIKVDLTNIKEERDLVTNELVDSYAEVENDGFGGQDKLYDIENIIGSEFNDEIAGDGKANVLNGGPGTDTLTGRGGADTFWVGEGDIITDFALEDKLIIPEELSNNVSFDYSNNNLTLLNSNGNVDTTVAVLENISSNQYQNVLNYLQFDINGQGGNDTMNGGGNSDSLYGFAGNDTLNGRGSSDNLYGGVGDDLLNGGLGSDRLYGEEGNDTLNGGGDRDSLYGGSGADNFILSDGRDIIADFSPIEGDQIIIDKDAFGISSLDDLRYNRVTKNLSRRQGRFIKTWQPIAKIEGFGFFGDNDGGFEINNDNISLV